MENETKNRIGKILISTKFIWNLKKSKNAKALFKTQRSFSVPTTKEPKTSDSSKRDERQVLKLFPIFLLKFYSNKL